MSTLIYKAVAVASSPVFEPYPTTVFAWNSRLLGGCEPSFDHPPDIMETLVKLWFCQDRTFINVIGVPDFVGISIWRGTVSVEFCQEVRVDQRFTGEWKDLTTQDWDYLRYRNLEGLVRLDRFTVDC